MFQQLVININLTFPIRPKAEDSFAITSAPLAIEQTYAY
jgi:hypothetical protein